MKVFISWSGSKSQAVAVALHEWLPGVINSVEPFVSSEDISAGARWQSDIASRLDASNFGIVCVTRENQESPWLNFEAGALAKAVEISRVIPLAIDLQPSDVKLPLGQFQAQPATEDGLRAVVVSINTAIGEQRLSDDLLRTSFDVWWPRLETQLATIEHEISDTTPPVRTERDLLEETLDTVRALARAIDLRPEPTLVEVLIEQQQRRAAINRAIQALPERERRVLTLRFGLEGGAPMTLEQVGQDLNLSRERVRQIESVALKRLEALRDLAFGPDDALE